MGGGKDDVVAFAVRGWHDHDDFRHSGDVCGHGVHDDGAGVGRLAAGDVDADAVKRGDFLPEQGAVCVAVVPAFLFLPAVVVLNARGGGLQGVACCSGQAFEGGAQVVWCEGQVLHAVCLHAIEAVAVFDEGGVATLAHVGADVGDDAFGFGILGAFKGEQGGEFAREFRGLGVEFFHGCLGTGERRIIAAAGAGFAGLHRFWPMGK